MTNRIVDLRGRPHAPPPPASDFWFAHVDHRLGRIEHVVARLEWQIWLVVCGCAGLLVIEVVKAITRGTS